MIENFDDLTIKQKEDLQKFANIAYKNKNLWWTDGDLLKGKPKTISLSDYFSWKIDILNEILINFPIIDRDVNDKEIKKVLQFISEDELMGTYIRPSLDICEVPLYCFRFKKQENLIDNDIVGFNITDLKELNTQELLDNLQSVLKTLKTGKFDSKFWTESR